MRKLIQLVLLLHFPFCLGQESVIRVLGAYPSHLSLSTAAMTSQLQGIVTAWNNSELPTSSVTTVQILNGALAVPVSYPGLPATNTAIAPQAYQQSSIQTLRHQWKADVIVLFTGNTDTCGATTRSWVNSDFVPTTQGMDLRFRHQWYIPVVSVTGCAVHVAAHEFGHLLGGGHWDSGDRLYSDANAWLYSEWDGYFLFYYATALVNPPEVPSPLVNWSLQYSRSSPGYGDADHNNVRTLSTTARSVANYYEYPNVPPILNPPTNLYGIFLGCVDGLNTRHDLYWSDDPATNVPISHYEIWKSQPVGQVPVYGWTSYGPSTPSYVIGATARARVNACSGSACSALSLSHYDAYPACQ